MKDSDTVGQVAQIVSRVFILGGLQAFEQPGLPL